MLEKYLIVEDREGKLSIVSNVEYRKENDKAIIYEPISGSDERKEAEEILAHIEDVGGVQNYFTEIMDKMDFHKVKNTGKNRCFNC